MRPLREAIQRETKRGLGAAVHRNRPLSRRGIQERLFTLAFRNLVYPQIWEDPVVDMEALRLGPSDRVAAIASGGCNVLSYLVADPAEIIAVDLNGAHIALNRLKIEGLRRLPDHVAFFDFFGWADTPSKSRPLRELGCARTWTRRRAPIGMRAASTGEDISKPLRAISIAMDCWGASSAPVTSSPVCTASDSTPCWRRKRWISNVAPSNRRSRRCLKSDLCSGSPAVPLRSMASEFRPPSIARSRGTGPMALPRS